MVRFIRGFYIALLDRIAIALALAVMLAWMVFFGIFLTVVGAWFAAADSVGAIRRAAIRIGRK